MGERRVGFIVVVALVLTAAMGTAGFASKKNGNAKNNGGNGQGRKVLELMQLRGENMFRVVKNLSDSLKNSGKVFIENRKGFRFQVLNKNGKLENRTATTIETAKNLLIIDGQPFEVTPRFDKEKGFLGYEHKKAQ